MMVTLVGEVYPGNIFVTREGFALSLIGNNYKVGGTTIVIGIIDELYRLRVVKYKNLATFHLLNSQVFD